MWAWFLIASTVLFKWVDQKGNLHVTDRLEDVPQKYRAEFAKKAEEAQKKKDPPPQIAVPSASDSDAYQRYQERRALEKAIRARSEGLRDGIGKTRKTIAELQEEYGNLASNPLLNAAQPGRKQRMEEIEKEVTQQRTSIEAKLDDLRQMLIDAKSQGAPDEWVTGM